MAGRFPGSADVDALWSNLIAGEDLITEIPEDRWDWRTVYDPEMARPDTTNSKWGGFIPDVAEFDHAFFGISPREARLMDPQHRLFLQVAYQAIEDAGRRPSELARGRTGVFVGVASHDYFELVRASGVPLEGYSATGMFHSLLPNRLSYYLNLSGPSFPIDAACSSSLVAIHTAVESLRSGNCDTAIAGGANLLLSPTIYVAFSRAGMLSPTGRCRTFDQAADGYVRGEGIGAVLLKPLRAALADGDHIHGIIRGSAVNHGGKVNTLTTPNPKAQAALIESAMAAANVSTEDLDYVEMHGTGTPLGDPIEVNGLKRALGRRRAERVDAPQSEVLIGSVKSSLGHLEAAAGMAGLFKVLLAMRHGVIPPNLHLHQLNEHIDLEGSGLRIVDRPTPWPSSTGPRTAGISSFGFGGINAHLVIQEARDLT
jgi:polyketide synthase